MKYASNSNYYYYLPEPQYEVHKSDVCSKLIIYFINEIKFHSLIINYVHKQTLSMITNANKLLM